MNGMLIISYCMITCLMLPHTVTLLGIKKTGQCKTRVSHDNKTIMMPVNALNISCTNRNLTTKVVPSHSVNGTAETREKTVSKKKKPTLLQKLGSFLMMIPIAMQFLSLPGALASIKMSLLKSIMVAKAAIVLLAISAFKYFKKPEVVVIPHPPPLHHQHYYNPYYEAEDEEPGWIGKWRQRYRSFA